MHNDFCKKILTKFNRWVRYSNNGIHQNCMSKGVRYCNTKYGLVMLNNRNIFSIWTSQEDLIQQVEFRVYHSVTLEDYRQRLMLTEQERTALYTFLNHIDVDFNSQ